MVGAFAVEHAHRDRNDLATHECALAGHELHPRCEHAAGRRTCVRGNVTALYFKLLLTTDVFALVKYISEVRR